MPDGFVDLQSQLRAVKDDVERTLGALVGMMQSNRLFGDAAGVLDKLQFLDQFVALVLPLSAERVWIRPLLNLVSRKRICGVACTRGILCLMDVRSFRRYKPLLFPLEVDIALVQRNDG